MSCLKSSLLLKIQNQYTKTLQVINLNWIKLNLEIIFKSDQETKQRKDRLELDLMKGIKNEMQALVLEVRVEKNAS